MSRTAIQLAVLAVALCMTLLVANSQTVAEHVAKVGFPGPEPQSNAELANIYLPICLEILEPGESKELCHPTARLLDLWRDAYESDYYDDHPDFAGRLQKLRTAGKAASVIVGGLLMLSLVRMVSRRRAALDARMGHGRDP